MADLQPLLTGLGFGESPRWHQDRLWLAHWGTQEVIAVDLDGNREVVVHVPTTRPETRPDSGGAGQGPYSIDWLPDGRLLIVAGRDGVLVRREPDGSLVPHGDLSGLDRGFNEIVVDGRGNAYVNGAASPSRVRSSPRLRRAGHPRRRGPPGGRWHRLSERHGREPDIRTWLPVAQGEEASWPRPGPMSIRSEAIYRGQDAGRVPAVTSRKRRARPS